MFKNIIRELEELGRGGTVSVPIEADERGYIDKECPAPKCLFVFKVLETDWRDKFRDEAVYCPQCGHEAPAKSWFTTEQIERGKEQALATVHARVDRALVDDAREFNATAPRGFISMSMKVSGATHAHHTIVPIAAAAVLEQMLVCDACGAGYAVLGPAFFCPCCGHNSVEKVFDGALAKVRTKIEGIEVVREALRATLGADEAETFCRSTIEGGLQDCVVAFQHLAERLYVLPAGATPPSQNTFQRLDDGSERWRAATGKGYDAWLSAAELEELSILFQRRHILAHRDGLVDEKYVQKSGDTTYKVGQRIVVGRDDVLRLVLLVEKLGRALRAAAKSAAP